MGNLLQRNKDKVKEVKRPDQVQWTKMRYISPRNNLIIVVKKQLKLKCKLLQYDKMPLNCAIGIFSQNTLFVAGGIEIGQEQGTNRTIKINLSTNIISQQEKLPFSSALGTLIKWNNDLVFIGAVTYNDQERIWQNAQICIYRMASDEWDLLSYINIDQMLYGGYINKNKLFILGGFLENGEYCRNVYAIDLISSKVKENILSFDIAAIAPKCLKWQNKILIVGSQYKQDEINFGRYKIWVFDGEKSYEQIYSKSKALDPHYNIIKVNDYLFVPQSQGFALYSPLRTKYKHRFLLDTHEDLFDQSYYKIYKNIFKQLKSIHNESFMEQRQIDEDYSIIVRQNQQRYSNIDKDYQKPAEDLLSILQSVEQNYQKSQKTQQKYIPRKKTKNERYSLSKPYSKAYHIEHPIIEARADKVDPEVVQISEQKIVRTNPRVNIRRVPKPTI